MYYKVSGKSGAEEQTVLLSSGLGGAHYYWQEQISVLAKRFRVITYDHFATGKSYGVLPDKYRVEDMADEVIELLSETRTEQVHFIGHALGGLIGLSLALRYPETISSLLLVNAWSKICQHTKHCFDIRKALLSSCGAEMYLKAQSLFLYPAAWMYDHPDTSYATSDSFSEHDCRMLRERIKAIEIFDVSQTIEKIQCRTGLICTMDDLLVPYQCSLQLREAISKSQYFQLDHGGHACNITQVEQFNAIMEQFFNKNNGEING